MLVLSNGEEGCITASKPAVRLKKDGSSTRRRGVAASGDSAHKVSLVLLREAVEGMWVRGFDNGIVPSMLEEAMQPGVAPGTGNAVWKRFFVGVALTCTCEAEPLRAGLFASLPRRN